MYSESNPTMITRCSDLLQLAQKSGHTSFYDKLLFYEIYLILLRFIFRIALFA